MLTVRKSEARGHANHGWLDSYHSFSFANYYDPDWMGLKTLRVINQDKVQAGQGFGTHPHRDMEIISYVLKGALEHKDSMGNGSIIKSGDVQRMSAGTGVLHSEFNHSQEHTVEFLQIWILPDKQGSQPEYEQKYFSPADKHNQLRLIASQDGRDGSITVHQDISLYASILDNGKTLNHSIKEGYSLWIQVISGQIDINQTVLKVGDGASLENISQLEIQALKESEFLVFELK